MLRILRKGQRWIMGFVIVVVGGVFAAFVGVGGPLFHGNAGNAVVDVDGHRYFATDLARTRAQQEEEVKRMLGDAFDSKAAGAQLDMMAANALVQSAILAREAKRLGLRVSDEEIVETVKQIPSFQDEQGKFRPDAVRGYIQYEYGTERRFLEAVRSQLLAQKVLKLLSDTASVSETEARDALRRQRDEVELAYVSIDASKPGADITISDEQVDALVTTDEPRIKAFYDGHPDRFNAPEKMRARHILLRVPKDASEPDIEAVRKRAEALHERVAGGEDFAKVATETSEDPGSKAKGGDLDFFQRGQMVKPFEDAAFALEPGAISAVVKTDFGFHVIKAEEKKPAATQTFEDVKREIARELVTGDAAMEAARRRANILAEKVKQGSTLEEAARADALTLERTEPLRRRADGFIPGLGASPEVLSAAFLLTKEQPNSSKIFEVGDKLVLIQLLNRREASVDDLVLEVPKERERMLEDERTRIQSTWIENERQALAAAGKLKVDLKAAEQQIR
jgi:peptidyl-prolyl cis-trans isomerase D